MSMCNDIIVNCVYSNDCQLFTLIAIYSIQQSDNMKIVFFLFEIASPLFRSYVVGFLKMFIRYSLSLKTVAVVLLTVYFPPLDPDRV